MQILFGGPGQKTNSRRMCPNQKVEENKPVLELNFILKYKCEGHDFEFGIISPSPIMYMLVTILVTMFLFLLLLF